MSAARVLNPVSDFCKISAGVVNRSLPSQLNRIKRDLFGAANPVETNKLFTEELDKHQEKAIKRWGFDFRAGSPLTANTQYIWERVSFQESAFAPDVYTLTRAAHVRPKATASSMDLLMDERAEREHSRTAALQLTDDEVTEEESCDDEEQCSSAVAAVFKVPATAVTVRPPSSRVGRKRQPKITEYMKERKRLAQTPKKIQASPAKRMRTSSPSATASSLNITHSVHAHSITSHFVARSRKH